MYRTGELQLLLKKAQTTVVSFIVVGCLNPCQSDQLHPQHHMPPVLLYDA